MSRFGLPAAQVEIRYRMWSDETFVVITDPERADQIRQHILDRFDRDAAQHYAFGERLGERVKVKDAAGQDVILPLLELEARC